MIEIVSRPVIAEGWPARTDRVVDPEPAEGPVPGEGVLSGPRWLLVWNKDPLGECCCPKGTARGEHGAQAGACQRPGKHPWMVKRDGVAEGFVHGAAQAMEYLDLADRYGPAGGMRQLGTTLADLIVVDLDTARAVRDFARLSFTVPKDKIVGVSTSPRGFHVWLDAPGWTQKALNLWMTQWLSHYGGWSGTDEKAAGRRGFLVDVRTGDNRYVVWPGSHPSRRWIGRAEFGQVLQRQLVGMPAWRMVPSDGQTSAPWAVDTAEGFLPQWIAEHSGGGGSEVEVGDLSFDGSQGELDYTWSELERWCDRLAEMPGKSGRNNTLNQVAYYSGALAVAAGHPREEVRARLVQAGRAAGTHGVEATVESGLSAGAQAVLKTVTAR